METSPSPLPCPFCGSHAEMIDNGYDTYWVMCMNEECSVAMGEVGVESPAQAIAKWNRRSQSAPEKS